MTTNKTQRIFSISKSFQDVNTILDNLDKQERSRFICEAIMFYHQSKTDGNWLMNQFQTMMQPMMAMQQMMNPMFNQQVASLTPQLPLQTGAEFEQLAKVQAEQLEKAQAEQLAKAQAELLAKEQAELLAKAQAELLAKEQAELLAKAQAVEKAETTKTQADVDVARILVNSLPDGADKIALTDRLNKVQAELLTKNNEKLLAGDVSAPQNLFDNQSQESTTGHPPTSSQSNSRINTREDGLDDKALLKNRKKGRASAQFMI